MLSLPPPRTTPDPRGLRNYVLREWGSLSWNWMATSANTCYKFISCGWLYSSADVSTVRAVKDREGSSGLVIVHHFFLTGFSQFAALADTLRPSTTVLSLAHTSLTMTPGVRPMVVATKAFLIWESQKLMNVNLNLFIDLPFSSAHGGWGGEGDSPSLTAIKTKHTHTHLGEVSDIYGKWKTDENVWRATPKTEHKQTGMDLSWKSLVLRG